METITRITLTDFQNAFGAHTDLARSHPLTLTKHGRDDLVIMSAEEYKRLKARDRQVYRTADAPEDLIEAVRTSEMDPRHSRLDAPLSKPQPE